MKTEQILSFKKRKRILLVSILSLILLILIVVSIPLVRAEDEEEDNTDNIEVLSDVEDEDYNSLLDVIEDEHKYMQRLDRLFDPSETDADGNKTILYTLMDDENAPAKAGRSIIMAIGLLLVILYTVIQVIKSLQRADQSLETLFRILLLAIIGVLVVIYSYDIVTKIEQIGHLLQTGIRNAVVGSEYESLPVVRKTVEFVEQTEENPNLFQTIGNWLKNVWVGIQNAANWISALFQNVWKWIYSKIITMITNIGLAITFYAILTSAYGLLFEMVIRKMFMPIAVADLMAEGVRGPAVKYMKNYFGVYIRIGMFYIILYMLLYMQGWVADNANFQMAVGINTRLGPFGAMICIRAAAKALINATGSLTKEALGG